MVPCVRFFSAEEMSFTVANGNAVSTKRRISELAAETTSSQRPKHLGRVVEHRTLFRLIQMIEGMGGQTEWFQYSDDDGIVDHEASGARKERAVEEAQKILDQLSQSVLEQSSESKHEEE